jgi:tetratricopeptide (TPR) repeat protein
LCAALRQHSEPIAEAPRANKQSAEPVYLGFQLEIDILRRAQLNYPADYWINNRLGISLIAMQGRDVVAEGIGYVRAAVALRPDSAHAVMSLGQGYEFLGQHDQAIGCFRKAIELSPRYTFCYSMLGVALGQKGLHEEAMAAFEQAIRIKPDHTDEAYAELAMLLSNCPDARLRNPRRAVELAEKAVQIEPNAANYWTALGVARYRESQWQEARTALDRSLEIGTHVVGFISLWETEAIDWFFLAMSNWQLGQQDQARQCYDRAVEWMEKRPRHDAQLLRFRAEAEELLGVNQPQPSTNPKLPEP